MVDHLFYYFIKLSFFTVNRILNFFNIIISKKINQPILYIIKYSFKKLKDFSQKKRLFDKRGEFI